MQDEIIKSLGVFWDGQKVGSYDKFQSGSEQFVYDAAYLGRVGCRPISHSLPLRTEPYSARQLRPFFSGLLPEEAQRTRIASYLGIAETNDFAFLEAMGGECAGALTILPQGERPAETLEEFRPMTEAALSQVIETLPLRPMLVGEEGVRLSLAGAQSKLPVVIREGRIGLPVGNGKKLSQELNLGFAQLLRRLKGLCGMIQDATPEGLSLPAECGPVLDLIRSRATRIAASLA